MRYAAPETGFAGLAALAVDIEAALGQRAVPPAAPRREGGSPGAVRPAGDDAWLAAFDGPLLQGAAPVAAPAAARRVLWPVVIAVALAVAVLLPLLREHGLNRLGGGEPAAADTAAFEQRPPVGRAEVLRPAQVRYCLAQGIRLAAAAARADAQGAAAQARYRSLYRDHEQRCAEYRYQAGTFEAARAAVEPRRAALVAEGVALVAAAVPGAAAPAARSSEGGDPVAAAAPARLQFESGEARREQAPMREIGGATRALRLYSPQPQRLIKDIQWRLYKLGHYRGPINGLDSAPMRVAAQRFVASHPELSAPSTDRVLFDQLEAIYQRR